MSYQITVNLDAGEDAIPHADYMDEGGGFKI